MRCCLLGVASDGTTFIMPYVNSKEAYLDRVAQVFVVQLFRELAAKRRATTTVAKGRRSATAVHDT